MNEQYNIASPTTCACRADDPRHCLILRSNVLLSDVAEDDECTCACHDDYEVWGEDEEVIGGGTTMNDGDNGNVKTKSTIPCPSEEKHEATREEEFLKAITDDDADKTKDARTFVPWAQSQKADGGTDHYTPSAVERAQQSVMRSVMQTWTMSLGIRHQGVILTAIRGCDTAPKESASKRLARYFRTAVLNPHCGDVYKAKSFFEVPTPDRFEEAVHLFFHEWDALPLHYVMHLAHAAEIVGYYHPHRITADLWLGLYLRIVRKLHLEPESKESLDARLDASEDDFGMAQKG